MSLARMRGFRWRPKATKSCSTCRPTSACPPPWTCLASIWQASPKTPAMPEAVMAPPGTVLAFDFGTRHIGVAVGESLLGLAHPLATISGEESGPRFAAIAELVDEWKPTHLVVG